MSAILQTFLVAEDSDDTRAMLRRAFEMRGHGSGKRSGCRGDGQKPAAPSFRCRSEHAEIRWSGNSQATMTAEEFADLPIIAVTAFDVYGLEEAALEMGCNQYLSKPLDLSDLDRALNGLSFLV